MRLQNLRTAICKAAPAVVNQEPDEVMAFQKPNATIRMKIERY
jgi:hypothetical protein